MARCDVFLIRRESGNRRNTVLTDEEYQHCRLSDPDQREPRGSYGVAEQSKWPLSKFTLFQLWPWCRSFRAQGKGVFTPEGPNQGPCSVALYTFWFWFHNANGTTNLRDASSPYILTRLISFGYTVLVVRPASFISVTSCLQK